MRLLIISEKVFWEQNHGDNKYHAPYDVHLKVDDPNKTEGFNSTIFDYDVAVIHIAESQHHTIGYFRNLPKISSDTYTALRNGRAVIILPNSSNFRPETGREYREPVYDWLQGLGIELKDSFGEDIRPSGAGKSKVIKDYLKYAPKYYQIVTKPTQNPDNWLAVVDETEIQVGIEHDVNSGTLVILPPPSLREEHYQFSMANLIMVARRYYEKSQRKIPVGDAPDWLESYLLSSALDINRRIEELSAEKSFFDRISYVLYGTGEELEASIALLLEQLGLEVEIQPKGSNIDLKAKHHELNIGFAFEVTGTKGTIHKGSNKISQAWQYLHDKAGTEEAKDRLIIVANTQYNLDPKERKRNSFSETAIQLLGHNQVLLITTIQLYNLWKAVREGEMESQEILKNLYSKSGIFEN